jgi:hypothetical protein
MRLGLILTTCAILIVCVLGVNRPEQAEDELMLSAPSTPEDRDSRLILPPSSSPRSAEPDRIAYLKFGNYPCTPDCSEHEAGYRWGKIQGISDPDNCSGNTGQFIEGCRVYAEEREAAYTVKPI